MLITSDQVDELLAVLAELTELDEELVQRCGFLIRTERYDEAVGRAFIVLEERMRALMGLNGGAGRHLVSKLFSSKDTQFTDRLYRPAEEVAGLRAIFEGSFAAFRNRAAHTVAGYRRDEARAIIHLVNLLLLTLDHMRFTPERHIQPEVEEALDPAVTERLQRFLASLGEIGFVREEGIAQDAYKAQLLYQFREWNEHRPHPVTVLYLTKKGADPGLRFRIDMLSAVKDLNVDELQAKLLAAGCTRANRNTTPVELVLTRRNDQATFDRLYEILADLIRKHQVG